MSDPLRVGILGAGWITRAHGHALHTIGHMRPLARPVELVALAARNPERGQAMADELGIGRFSTDWRAVVEDPDVDVVANLLAQAVHVEATEAALALGKPVFCEKPLGIDRFESRRLADAAAAAGVPAVTGFNYRYIPAMRLAREIVESGRLGDAVHFRAVYLQDHAAGGTPLRPHNGSHAVTDYIHLVDFMRYLGCEAEAVQARMAKLTSFGPDVEDAYVAAVDLRGGGLGSLEVSRVAWGWKGRQVIEFNGTTGSLWWDMEDLNRLHVFYSADEADRTGGFRDILVSQPDHPFMDLWWPPGHTVGWEHSFVHEWRDFLSAIIDVRPISPEQASFEDGYEASLVCDAIALSSSEGRRVRVDELRSSESR
ncbi:MAG TPA: Gfo/Idh/MocA family oxidoreductase [Candidatus Limnocylindrales bacterium]|nr:Gfo/Idh/MocA family oxidoreductase [Candidatus Limnocylindrales bacterium]